MCVTFVYIKPETCTNNSKYKLIILNNRDEIISRKTSKLSWENGILCGRDEESLVRGTWFGTTTTGKIGILLSITQPSSEKDSHASSRGGIVIDYLNSPDSAEIYVENLSKYLHAFNGFQFLAFDRKPNKTYELRTIVHKYVDESLPRKWPVDGGVYGFGNSPPEKPYKKVTHGTHLFRNSIEKIMGNHNTDEVFEELLKVAKNDNFCEPDEQLQLQTGYDQNDCHYLTSLFIQQQRNGNYGTRSHSILLIDINDNATFYESRLISGNNIDGKWETNVEKFKIID